MLEDIVKTGKNEKIKRRIDKRADKRENPKQEIVVRSHERKNTENRK